MDTALSALKDFREARLQANLQTLLARLTGRTNELLSYDEVRKRLKGVENATEHLEEIPLADIVGSVGRYSDFNRSFLPLKDSGQARWTGVKQATSGLTGVPPIEVYRIGNAYFVKDGNHRVSVARQQGNKYIEAYVTDVQTPVPLEPDVRPEDLILKEEYAEFLDKTQLHKLRPDEDINAPLRVTAAGGYEKMLEHIQIHRYYMGLDHQRDIDYFEAVTDWLDAIYLPVKGLMEQLGLLDDFPGRTAADLYLWLADYQRELEAELGWQLTPATVAMGVSDQVSSKPRQQRARETSPTNYFADEILVAVPGDEAGWKALEQSFAIARREQARIYGLHVVPDEQAAHSQAVRDVRQTFAEHCQQAGVKGQLAVEIGEVIPLLTDRARWVDLLVATLSHPPKNSLSLSDGLSNTFGLNKGFQRLVRDLPRPVLAVPKAITPITKALLAYDGSAKADIALFAAAYLATRWRLPLAVVTVTERTVGKQTLAKAEAYLAQHGVNADCLLKDGSIVTTLLETVIAEEADLLIVGGYSYGPVLEPLLGGVLDELLRQSPTPMLICQ